MSPRCSRSVPRHPRCAWPRSMSTAVTPGLPSSRDWSTHGYHDPRASPPDRAQGGPPIAGEEADSAADPGGDAFGLLLTAGELAKAFRLLPAETEVEDAVQWGWQRFGASSDALALDPPAQVVATLRTGSPSGGA